MPKSYIWVVSNSSFRNLWLGQITSQLSLNMLSFVLAIRVYRETSSNTSVALMLLTFGVPAIIFGVIAGSIVDHYDKRDVLVFSNIARVVIFFLFYLFSHSLLALYILNVLISIATQLFIPAEAPIIPYLVKKTNLLTANSLFTVSFYLSTMAGFIVAGPVLKSTGPQKVYFPMLFLMFVSWFLVTKLPKTVDKKRPKKLSFSSIGRTIDYGIRFIKRHKRIKQSLILMTFAQALIAALAALAPGFADTVLKIELTDASILVLGPAAIGLVLGAFFVGGIGSNYLKGTIILIGILATGTNLILLSLYESIFSSLIFATILLFFLGVFNSFITVPANTILQQDTSGEIRGRVYGVLTSLTGGVSLAPVVFSGIIADYLGVTHALFGIGVFILAVGIFHYLKRRG